MSISYEQILAPVASHMKGFRGYFDSLIEFPRGMLRTILRYALGAHGKQLRPLLVYLSAGAVGEINGATRAGAAMVELVHNASLLHDDVIDQAELRRGLPAVYRLWRAKGAVLAGDYMLALGLRLAVDSGQYGLLEHMNRAVQRMSESEVEQLRRARTQRLDEEGYYEVIRGKTAALLSTCTACGGVSVGAPDYAVQALRLYGEQLGMAFQIQDDILDFSTSALVGKKAGNDLREGKFTLPIIYALHSVSGISAKRARRLVLHAKTDERAFKEAFSFVLSSGALARAADTANGFTQSAKAALDALPGSRCRDSLRLLADYLTQRKK